MVRIGAGNKDRCLVLTISEGFKENPQEFGSTKAHHSGDKIWAEGEGGEGGIQSLQLLYVHRTCAPIVQRSGWS